VGAQSGQYVSPAVAASAKTVNSILHPFDLTFDQTGNIYLSSQDTNVVTGLDGQGTALSIPSYLASTYPKGQFLSGTQVASSVGGLPSSPAPPPQSVPTPQGLAVAFTSGNDRKVEHSVRGVVWAGTCLLVADEPGDAVKVYSANGQLQGQIAGNGLKQPVHLLLEGETLYISASNDTIYSYRMAAANPPQGTVAPTPWLTDHLHSPSGMCFDSGGNFYVAQRKRKEVRQFDSSGKYKGPLISNLADEPEFIVYQATLPS